MDKILIVDGYNVIGAWSEAVAWPIDESRDRLIEILQEYGALIDSYVILVFDGYKSNNLSTSIEERQNIRIVYTKKDQTADSYIESTVYKMPKYYKLCVATSDAAEQFMVMGNGAARISSRELLESIALKRNKNIVQNDKLLKQNTRNSLASRLSHDVFQKLESLRKSR